MLIKHEDDDRAGRGWRPASRASSSSSSPGAVETRSFMLEIARGRQLLPNETVVISHHEMRSEFEIRVHVRRAVSPASEATSSFQIQGRDCFTENSRTPVQSLPLCWIQ